MKRLLIGLIACGLLVAAAPAQARLVAYVSDSCEQGGEDRPAFFGPRRCPNSIWVADVDGSNPRRVTQGFSEFAGGGDGNPVWSPDGSRIVYERQEHVPQSRKRLWSVRPDGTGAFPLTAGGTYMDDFNPVFSPDGLLIAFTTTRFDQHGGNAVTAVMVTSALGGEPKVISDTVSSNHVSAWTSDAKRVIYSQQVAALEPPPATIYSVGLDAVDRQVALVGSVLPPQALHSPNGRYLAWRTPSFGTAMADLVAGTTERVGPPGILPVRFEQDQPATLRAVAYDRSNGPPEDIRYYDIALDQPGRPHTRLPKSVPDGPQQPDGLLGLRPLGLPAVLTYVDPDPPFTGGPAPQDPWANDRATARAASAESPNSPFAFTAVAHAGVRSIAASLARRRGQGRCSYFTGRRFTVRDRCRRTHLRRIRSARAWEKRTSSLPRGTYELRFRVIDRRGRASKRRAPQIVRVR